jgi:hypothetical protein
MNLPFPSTRAEAGSVLGPCWNLMICTAEMSVGLLLVEKLLRRLGEATNLFEKGIIGEPNRQHLFKTGNPEIDRFSEVTTGLAAVIWVHTPQIMALAGLESRTGKLHENTL